jgi:hypothetical protein
MLNHAFGARAEPFDVTNAKVAESGVGGQRARVALTDMAVAKTAHRKFLTLQVKQLSLGRHVQVHGFAGKTSNCVQDPFVAVGVRQ